MRRRATGFTLIEMMVTIAIFVIVTAVAMVSYQALITNFRMTTEMNALSGSLSFARSEAMKRGQIVSVCPISGTACGSSTNWSLGWYTLLNSPSTQLSISPSVTHGDTLTSTTTSYPTFNPAGYTFYTGTIYLHDVNNTQQRCIIFNAGAWTTNKGAACP